jgi:GMP synthase-like glutamine amidotransferase
MNAKPVLIFRHTRNEGPGYVAGFLAHRSIPYRLVRVDAGEPVPTSLDGVAGLVFMGGPMSVNDRLPWLPPTFEMIRKAVAADVPVLGHCLGGQLMAKALGGRVTRNRVKEIGWLKVEALDSPQARHWANGLASPFEVFHWHGETFSELPPGATPLLRSRACRHQAFALGKHLGFQCHVEMTPEMVRSWARSGSKEIAQTSATVQSEQQMRTNLVARIERLNRIADVFYSRWVEGLRS